jgi:hypothetical protein
MTFNRIHRSCVKPNPKHRSTKIDHSSHASTTHIIDKNLVENPTDFLDHFVKTHKLSTIGSDTQKVSVVRIKHGELIFDIGVAGERVTPLGLYSPYEVPPHERTPYAKSWGVWTGSFDADGLPYLAYGYKIYKFNGTTKIPVVASAEDLALSRKLEHWSLKQLQASLKPKKAPKPIVSRAMPGREPVAFTTGTFMEKTLAHTRAKEAKHARDSKKKYDRIKKKYPGKNAYDLLSLSKH